MKGQDGCYILFPLGQLKMSTCPLFLPLSFPQGGKLRHGQGKRPPAFQFLPPRPVRTTGKTGSCWDCFQGEQGASGRIGLYFCSPGMNCWRKGLLHGAKMQQLPRGVGRRIWGWWRKKGACSPPAKPKNCCGLGFFSSRFPIPSPHTRSWSCHFHFLASNKASKQIYMKFPPLPNPKANFSFFPQTVLVAFSIAPNGDVHHGACRRGH